MDRIKKIKSIYLIAIIAIVLFFIPFTWFKPGEIDLGGDSTRLYFYDPLHYLTSHTLYGISSTGLGVENISYYGLPFIVSLIILKSIITFPSVLNAAFHGFSLVVAFLSVYGCVAVILSQAKITEKKQIISLASCVAGLLYVFSPSLIEGWDKAILTHNQFFLNPLIFFLLLRFFITHKMSYLLLILLTTFIFSPNFAFAGAPSFFSFYPLSLVFLFVYSLFVLKKMPPLAKLLAAFIIFVMLQMFHVLPLLYSMFDTTSYSSQALFSEQYKFIRGLSYFVSVAQSVKVSSNLLFLQQSTRTGLVDFLFVIFPAIIISAFLLKRNRTLLLVGSFFLIICFFASANITSLGFTFYKQLFSLPGFSMFRNFYGQLVFAFSFYYVILFGIALVVVLQKIKKAYHLLIVFILLILVSINAYPFINGELINKELWNSNGKKIFVSPDPAFEDAIAKIRALPIDGKVLTLPLTDPGYQMFQGTNGGVYQGPSTVSYLAGKKDFSGIQEIDPFAASFLLAAQKKNYEDLKKILALLNVKYIFYNSDPEIYNDFAEFPYERVKLFLPREQTGYKKFVEGLNANQIEKFGKYYSLSSLDDKEYLPHIYIPTKNVFTNDPVTAATFIEANDPRIGIFSFNDGSQIAKDEDLFVKLKNEGPLEHVFDNFHLHTHNPYISQDISSGLYGYIVFKEENELKNVSGDIDEYLTQGLFLATKRIVEMEQFGSSLHATGVEWKKPNIVFFGRYNSWEASFSRYESLVRSLIDYVNVHTSPADRVKYQIIIDEQLRKHEPKLAKAIRNSSKTAKEREYLQNKERIMFDSLYALTEKPIISSESIPYMTDVKNIPDGEYYIYIKKDEVKDSVEGIAISYKGKNYQKVEETDEYIIFGPFSISDSSPVFDFVSLPSNVLDVASQPVITDKKDAEKFLSSNQTFTFNNETGSYFDGIIRRISKWEPNTQYLITFDYVTYGDDFLFKFYEKKREKNNKISINEYFGKTLNSDDWKPHQAIITSDKTGMTGFVQFLSDNDNEKGKIDIRNLTVSKVTNPTIFLRRAQVSPVPVQAVPKITFTKINPTQYKVHVNDIAGKFMLILSDGFSGKWKLYEDTSASSQNKIIASYFDGAIREGKAENTFLSGGIFNNLQRRFLPESNHFMANGYANGWVVDPADFSNKKEVNLILEFETQRVFLIGLVISLATFILIIVALIFFLFYERKK